MIFDPICQYCENKDLACQTPCAPLTWIDGNVSRKEVLLADLKISDDYELKDYKDILNELRETAETRLELISNIPNIKKRAILAMLSVGISRNDISTILSMSHRQIIRIIKHNNDINHHKT
jgi:hypothetical protein